MAAPKRPKVTSVQEAAVRTAETGSSADIDVGDWLAGDEKNSGDTRELQRHDTTTFDMTETSVTPVPPAPTPEEPPGAKPGKSAPGKLPAQPKSSTDDSHSAAAEMLKKLRRRT
jgi:hypothetical protein